VSPFMIIMTASWRRRRNCSSPNFTRNTGRRNARENTEQHNPLEKGRHRNKCNRLLVGCFFQFSLVPEFCFSSLCFGICPSSFLRRLLKLLVTYSKSWRSDHLTALV